MLELRIAVEAGEMARREVRPGILQKIGVREDGIAGSVNLCGSQAFENDEAALDQVFGTTCNETIIHAS
jgi:hypothetical protein